MNDKEKSAKRDAIIITTTNTTINKGNLKNDYVSNHLGVSL